MKEKFEAILEWYFIRTDKYGRVADTAISAVVGGLTGLVVYWLLT